MQLTEEDITYSVSEYLSSKGWEIISVHPPDGQGPFTIPRKTEKKIERASYFPDIVALKKRNKNVILFENKLNKSELFEDIKKYKMLSEDKYALKYILFRCRNMDEFNTDGFDFEKIKERDIYKHIRFGFSYGINDSTEKMPTEINDIKCMILNVSTSDDGKKKVKLISKTRCAKILLC